MESFGRYLRAEREAREVSIDDLARVTKINRHILHAIESDAFDDLPAPVFVRGFVRSIARMLGLSESEVVALYEDYLKTHGPGAGIPSAPYPDGPAPAPAVAGRSTRGPVTFALGLLLFVLALAGAYWFRSQQSGTPTAAEPQQAEEPSSLAVGTEAAAPPTGTGRVRANEAGAELRQQPESGTQREAAGPSAPVPPENSLLAAAPTRTIVAEKKPQGEAQSHWLVLQARGECWVKVRRDADEPREYTLREGERFSQRFSDRLILTVGDPAQLSLEVAGTRYGRLGPAGQVVTLAFPLDEKTQKRLEALGQEPRRPASESAPPPPHQPPNPGRRATQ